MSKLMKWYTGIFILYTILVSHCQTIYGAPDPKQCTVDFPNMHCGHETNRIPAAETGAQKIQRMYLRNCSKLIFRDDDFVDYNDLTELYISSVNMMAQKASVPLDKFANLSKLKKFEFTESGLTDQYMWILPPSVEMYNVSHNNYTYLDLSTAPLLKQIVADKNMLKYLPVYSNPPPPIQMMNLMGNPLDKLTVEYILPLCQLHQLEWKMIKNSYLNTTQGICDCLRLYKWMKKFALKDFQIECQPLPDEIECDLSFGHVKFLRHSCPDVGKIQDPPKPPTLPLTIPLLSGIPPTTPLSHSTTKLPPSMLPLSTTDRTPSPAPPTSMTPSPTPFRKLLPNVLPPSTTDSTPSPEPSTPTTSSLITSPSPSPLDSTTPTNPPNPIPFPWSLDMPDPTLDPQAPVAPVATTRTPGSPADIQIPTPLPDSLPGWFMFILGGIVATVVWLSLASVAYVMNSSSSSSAPEEQEEED